MEENVFIIHSSEIIRKGLAWILQEYFNMEITQLSSARDLGSFSEISNSLIIIIMEDGDYIPADVEEKLNRNNSLFIVLFTKEGKTATELNGGPEFQLNELSSSLQIQKLIQVIRKSASKQKNNLPENGELTLREKDVIRLIALGYSNKEIADKLNISIHTAISHRKNITEKLSIKSISGLTVYAIMNNLIDIKDINPEELI